ncbi:hypothetical protein [Sphingomonas xinjiangensis]|uniref:Uncharacterized protein n=1 Tax=Sphingomonas xinjiangensis TaxID=643568 RepID=A0A840YDX6_9SPHN|nr:hypothetical protein [Sphingomonas xinjiangensis]MBB5711627.1 hypothetical protein [Sphingomonas xinjiangensis]
MSDNAQSESGIAAASSPARGLVSRLSAENLALAFTAIAGFLVFSGQGYYNSLFSGFAIKPGLIEITHAELVTKGVECTLYAILTMIFENWFSWLAGAFVGISLGLLLALAIFKFNRVRHAVQITSPVFTFVGRITPISLKWMFGLLLATTGLIAGSKGGKLDADHIRQARGRFPNCVAVSGVLYRGHVLAQDKERLVLVQRTRTRLINTHDFSYITACPRA